MYLKFYVTIKELIKGGEGCEITKERPNRERYVKVLVDDSANCYRGANYVYFKNTLLASEIRRGARGSWNEDITREPSIGLLDDALIEAVNLGIIKAKEGDLRACQCIPYDHGFYLDNGNYELCSSTGFQKLIGDTWCNEYVDSTGELHYGN